MRRYIRFNKRTYLWEVVEQGVPIATAYTFKKAQEVYKICHKEMEKYGG